MMIKPEVFDNDIISNSPDYEEEYRPSASNDEFLG